MIFTIVAKRLTESSYNGLYQNHEKLWKNTFWYCFYYNGKIYIKLTYPNNSFPYELQMYAKKKDVINYKLYRLFFMGLLTCCDVKLGKNKIKVFRRNGVVFFVVNGKKYKY